jgi:hypothetical protein
MTTLKGLTIVAALLAGGASLAFAQNAPPTGGQPPGGGPYLQSAAPGPGPVTTPRHPTTKHKKMSMHSGKHNKMSMHSGKHNKMYMRGDSTAANAAASGGSGTHKGGLKTGSAANNQKVLKNQSGYR